ncbi:MAG: DUF1492 domain-containing protein [Ruminiclostridium sp.]
MTAKEYLSQYAALDAEINCKLEQLAKLRALSTSIPAPSGGGSSGSPSDRTGNITAKIVDMENEFNAKIDRLVDLQKKIETTIEAVEDSRYRTILTERYINRKKWEDIADILHIDLRWLYVLHGRALNEIKIHH